MEKFDYGNSPIYTITESSFEECKRKLYEQYFDNYKIIDRKTICKAGFLGIGQKEFVEVKYIIASREQKTKQFDKFEQNKEELLKQLTTSSSTTKQMAKLEEKFDSMYELLEEKFSSLAKSSETPHETILRIHELLEENEFTKEYIKNIEDKIRSEFSLEELDDFDKVEKKVVDWIGESILVMKKKPHRPPHVIVIVGPTGVGKTTTIAKIAAQQIVKADKEGLERPSLRLICADRTRVAAEDQLIKYAETLNIPEKKKKSTEDIKTIYRNYKETTDIILIDTSGYSPNDSENIARLKRTLSTDGIKLDIYLAINASTKSRDIKNIIQNFEPFGFNSIIVTKCDETTQYGNIISILSEKQKSISFLTFGQSVVNDISRADVIYFLIRLNGFTIDRLHIEDKFGE